MGLFFSLLRLLPPIFVGVSGGQRLHRVKRVGGGSLPAAEPGGWESGGPPHLLPTGGVFRFSVGDYLAALTKMFICVLGRPSPGGSWVISGWQLSFENREGVGLVYQVESRE